MSPPSYSLRLNKAALIFLPPVYPNPTTEHPSSDAQVVQVMVKSRKYTKRSIEAFYKAEREITGAIESLLIAHIASPLPQNLTIEGDGFTLHAKHAPWTYAKDNVRFSWGEKELKAADDKWVFVLDLGEA